MLVPTDLGRFAQVCAAVGNDVATDEEGFVAIERLVSRLGARLLLRPLLVEGMVASLGQTDSASQSKGQWAVLIDSDTYPITPAELQSEAFGNPLPWRFRNTVAHEVVHLLAFRANEFGVRSQDVTTLRGRQEDIVKAIERDTEKLSPLLLWPEKAIEKLVTNRTEPISILDLVETSRVMGISRQVLISRLNLIPESDPLRLKQTRRLRNVAIGVAEWIDKKVASLRKWPLFINFDRNIVPSFLLNLKKQERLSASLVVQDKSFGMCGGWNSTVKFECHAGVPEAIDAHSMHVQLSMEWVERAPGNAFFFVVGKSAQ
jgi:hypothetical protein